MGVWGLGFGVWSLEFGVWSLGFRVPGSTPAVGLFIVEMLPRMVYKPTSLFEHRLPGPHRRY